MSAKNTIAENFPECENWDKNSFVGILHEQQCWSHVQYWALEQALYKICPEEKSAVENLMLFYVFSFVFGAIGSHLDKDDFFEIKNLSREEVYSFRERVALMFEGVFRGRMPSQGIFELINPLMK